ncbi:hypothetical protein A2614_02455 [Candidatus Woesebacteria bacterium RIFOXYD1_FULL_40_21]|uniref:Uncharacterized protein n=2 Tax=Candidatus Woeseibacteriota TaxID=1752722 RepID=A0A1F8DJI2_9BACT|nr:MAG: hypothetical protein UT72_C0010G0002 [Candidatus Woesebacteria bacterium GW2011_GWB1_40_101]OGM87945.1 MAG: hypothetical protein A2614_02455 [Candidatus Woesebacteria bacterium RIFOXYD1_FULL_40_21]
MTSLTQTAIVTRKIIRYGVFFLTFLIVGKIVLDASLGIYRKIFPPPPPVPTVKFGKLTKLPFPEQQRPENLTLSVETPEGGLPKLATQTKVYFMPKLNPNLLSLDVAKDKANSLGFSPNEEQISPTVYKFPHKTSPSTLEINIVTGIFSISFDLKADSSALERRPPAPEIAASTVRAYLSTANLLPEDLSGQATHEFLKLESSGFVSAPALSEANLIKINLFRKSFDNFPSLTTDPNKANVWFMVSGAREREKQVIAAEFHYFPVDESQFSTYPTKTSEEAWDELTTKGGGFIANPGQAKSGETIKVRRIYLAYYDAGIPMEFFQPIIVFEGDNGFVAYVPAVTNDYYGQ